MLSIPRDLKFTVPIVLLVSTGVAIWAFRAQPQLPQHLVGQLPGPVFKHAVIDNNPPGAANDCCMDVLALGDIDADGNLDVVIGTENAGAKGLVWYRSPDWARFPIGTGNFTTDGEVADLDGDGDQDVVTSQNEPATVEWFENDTKTDRSTTWRRHLIGARYAHDIVIADVNGDGRKDVVINSKPGVSGWFEAPVTPATIWQFHPIPDEEGEGLDAGDIDGDGDVDIAASRFWYENLDASGLRWARHEVISDWSIDTRVVIADMNGDRKMDLVMSHSEGRGRMSWFEHRDNGWLEHPIEKQHLEGAHSLEVGDIDGDGLPDVLTGEMHTSSGRRIVLYRNAGDGTWQPVYLSRTGTHNARLGDIDSDGDLDVVGKNYGGPGRRVEMWENLSANLPAAGSWSYGSIASDRPESEHGKMGLVFADVNADRRPDMIAGSYAYLNPGGRLDASWRSVALPENIDVYFAPEVDGDIRADLVGIRDSTVMWIEAPARAGAPWTTCTVGKVPDARTQGYTMAQVVPGGKKELVFTRGKNLFYLQVPDEVNGCAAWPMVRVSARNEEEGVAAGDIDRDGDIDLAAQSDDGHYVLWFENKATGKGDWPIHLVGSSREWLDRIALADFNGDGRLDVAVSEESQDWFYNCRVYWYEAPADPSASWTRHTVAVLRSVNSMDVADFDGDGDPDIVAAEHTDQGGKQGAPDNLTAIYENRGAGHSWTPRIVEIGNHSSHLGARVHDLDGDGDLDIVSIAWSQSRFVHLWRNDLPRSAAAQMRMKMRR